MKPKVIFIPGNGGGSPKDNWFPYVKDTLEGAGVQVIAAKFPDPYLSRSSFWLPFLLEELSVDEDTVLIGHSSGAVAAMRFAEKYKILGSVLVSACYTDLGIEVEKQSGYFDLPWNWERIGFNQKWTVLFASQDDKLIPIDEPRHIHQQLNCEYHEFTNQGHFGYDNFKSEFPELTSAVLRNLNNL